MMLGTAANIASNNTRQAAPRFGELDAEQEKKIFSLLPPKSKVAALINQYENASSAPFGFEPTSKAEDRAKEGKSLEKQLLKEINNPKFTRENAEEVLGSIYKGRHSLNHQLPKEIFDAIYNKATARENTKPPELPEAIKKRLINRKVLALPQDLLAAFASNAYQKPVKFE